MGLLDKLFKKKEKKIEPAKTISSKEKKKAAVLSLKKEVSSKTVPVATTRKTPKGETGLAYRVLIKPLVTEKVTDLGAASKYVFAVSPASSKQEVREAIKKVYSVNPVKINIINIKGGPITYGRTRGYTKTWKKAVITLKPGEKLEIFEGV